MAHSYDEVVTVVDKLRQIFVAIALPIPNVNEHNVLRYVLTTLQELLAPTVTFVPIWSSRFFVPFSFRPRHKTLDSQENRRSVGADSQ